jgi:hypothetical protein
MAGRQSKAKRANLVGAMDVMAIQLLDEAEKSESLADRVAAFEKVGKWVAIKNRLEFGDEDAGTTVNDLKARLQGHHKRGKSGSVERFNDPAAARAASLKRWRGDCLAGADGNGGALLDGLKAKLPSFGGRDGKPLKDD